MTNLRAYFKRLESLNGFSFCDDKPSNDKTQIKKNLSIFDKCINTSDIQDSQRIILFKKIRNEIASGKLVFKDGLSEQEVNNLKCLITEDLHELAYEEKDIILDQHCSTQHDFDFSNAENIGISKNYVDQFKSKRAAYTLMIGNFLTDEQFAKLGEINKFNIDSKHDIEKLRQKLEPILTDEQKSKLNEKGVQLNDLAEAILKRGLYTKYTDVYVKNVSIKQEENIMIGKVTIDTQESRPASSFVKTTPFNASNTDKINVKAVLGETKIADINTDHNQALDVIEAAKKQGIKMPSTIINFDSHSDLYNTDNLNGIQSIASWLNYAAGEDGVEQVVWVVPEKSIKNNPKAYQIYFGLNLKGQSIIGNEDPLQAYRDLSKPLVQTFYMDKKSKGLFPAYYYKDEEIKNLLANGTIKKIQLITCTESNMPDFKNKDVMLSFDADYFNNCGFDTGYQVTNTPDDINDSFSSALKTLKEKHVKPSIANFTISPQYTSYERNDEAYGYYKFLMANTPQKTDNIEFYTRKKGIKSGQILHVKSDY